MKRNDYPFVSTPMLFGYLITLYAWIAEMFVLLLHFFANQQLKVAPIAHVMLLAVSLALTVYAVMRGRRDFALLRASGGRIPVTRPQIVLVTMFVMGLVATATLVFILLFDPR